MSISYRLKPPGKPSYSNASDLLADCRPGSYQLTFAVENAGAGEVLDDNGLVMKVISAESSPPTPPTPSDLYQFHHINILSGDWKRSRDFYEATFGLRTVMQFIDDNGGAFLFLADPFVDFESHHSFLEITGPPWGEQREHDHFTNHGPSIDHICYTSTDVDAAWQQLLDAGATNVTAPYDAWGTRLAWVKDLAGRDIEIMLPPSKDDFD